MSNKKNDRIFHGLDAKLEYELWLINSDGTTEFYSKIIAQPGGVFVVPGNFRNHHFEVRSAR